MTPPEFFGQDRFDLRAQSLPRLALADLPAHAHALGERHVDEEPAGQRDLRGDARSLRGDRLLGDLNDQVLAALENILDRRRLRAAPASAAATSPPPPPLSSSSLVIVVVVIVVVGFVFGIDEIGRVQERALLRADVDERCLNAGKDRFYSSEVDVADHAAGLGTVDQKLNELVVLDDGDPRFARVRVDQNLSFHRCPPRSGSRRLDGRAWRKCQG